MNKFFFKWTHSNKTKINQSTIRHVSYIKVNESLIANVTGYFPE